MKPYTDKEAGWLLSVYGTVFTMTKLVDGKVELFILDHDEVTIKELQDEQEL